MSEQIKIIHHLEDLYGPRPLLREAAQLLAAPVPTPENGGVPDTCKEANKALAAALIACS